MGIILLVLCCGICLLPNITAVPRTVKEAQQAGDLFFALMQRSDFTGAELHISPDARTYYSAAELRQRWSLVQKQIGAIRDCHMMRYQIELQGLRASVRLEYHIVGSKGDARANLRVERRNGKMYIQSMELVF